MEKKEFKRFWKIGSNAGGLTNKNDAYLSKNIEKNPQHLVKNTSALLRKCVFLLPQATIDVEHSGATLGH